MKIGATAIDPEFLRFVGTFVLGLLFRGEPPTLRGVMKKGGARSATGEGASKPAGISGSEQCVIPNFSWVT